MNEIAAVIINKTVLIIGLAAFLGLHYVLSIAALTRLFKSHPSKAYAIIWNIIIVLVIIIGPMSYITASVSKKKIRDITETAVKKPIETEEKNGNDYTI